MKFEYFMPENGNVKIWVRSDDNDPAVEISIPSLYQGARVTSITASSGLNGRLERINISEHLTEGVEESISMLSGNFLQGVFVNRGNPVYADIDGVLFSKPDKRLVCYPSGKPGVCYAIPDGVATIAENAFQISYNDLRQIHLPDSIRLNRSVQVPYNLESINIPNGVDLSALQQSRFLPSGIREVTVSPTHPTLVNFAGNVFDRYRRRLVLVTRTANSVDCSSIKIPSWVIEIGAYAHLWLEFDYAIPEGIRQIGKGAIFACKPLTLTLPRSVVSIDENAFSGSIGEGDTHRLASGPECIKLCVYAGTYGEKYAFNNHFTYECIGNARYTHDWLK